MNKQEYNREDLDAYLLGFLPEAVDERFDELSFTDEEFSERLSAAENDLIDAYVQNELTGAMLEKFKSHYLASPLRREKVEFARTFQIYAERHTGAMEKVAFEKSKSEESSGFYSILNVFKKSRPLLQWSFAVVALAFLLFGGFLIVNNFLSRQQNQLAKQEPPATENKRELPTTVETPRLENDSVEREVAQANVRNQLPPTPEKTETNRQTAAEPTRPPVKEKPSAPPKINVASFVLVPSLRSGNRVASLSVSKEITDVAMQLQLESDDYAAYRVVLLNESNAKLWQSQTVKAGGKGAIKTLNVSFPAKLLKSQIYSLEVSGVAADGELEIISNYVFRIVR